MMLGSSWRRDGAMSKKTDRRGSPAGNGQARQEPVPVDRGFDRWLNRQLHRLYDPVLEEQIPDELARLLEQFEQRTKDGGPDDGKGPARTS
jgi:hypothetical protein